MIVLFFSGSGFYYQNYLEIKKYLISKFLTQMIQNIFIGNFQTSWISCFICTLPFCSTLYPFPASCVIGTQRRSASIKFRFLVFLLFKSWKQFWSAAIGRAVKIKYIRKNSSLLRVYKIFLEITKIFEMFWNAKISK